jgi:hypothetical protein
MEASPSELPSDSLAPRDLSRFTGYATTVLASSRRGNIWIGAKILGSWVAEYRQRYVVDTTCVQLRIYCNRKRIVISAT